MKKEKNNPGGENKPKPQKQSKGPDSKMSPADDQSENTGTQSIHGGFQPTLHRKPFGDKSRMPLSSEEYEEDDFEIDGE